MKRLSQNTKHLINPLFLSLLTMTEIQSCNKRIASYKNLLLFLPEHSRPRNSYGHQYNSQRWFINFKVCKSMRHRTIQINHQPDATVFQFTILTFIYSSTCLGRFPAHHQELNDCSGSLWFYLRIVVTVVLCSWSGRPAGPTKNWWWAGKRPRHVEL